MYANVEDTFTHTLAHCVCVLYTGMKYAYWRIVEPPIAEVDLSKSDIFITFISESVGVETAF